MAVKGMYFLNSGWLNVDHGTMTARNKMGEQVAIPVVPVLLDTEDGWILFDTGLDPVGFSNPDEVWGVKAKVVKELNKDYDIREQLKDLNVKPEDIRFVINSHLHWDHCGGNRFFKNATFIVQKSEYRFALYPDSFEESLYIKNHFNYPLNYHLIEGDTKIVDGVHVISTAGHTIGHQSLIFDHVKLGKFILVGDVFYCKEAVDQIIPPGIINNLPQAYESMKRLLSMAERENAQLLITHEPDFWTEYKELIGGKVKNE